LRTCQKKNRFRTSKDDFFIAPSPRQLIRPKKWLRPISLSKYFFSMCGRYL
jgi:hypothetical protein